jgi:hypothetical protein
MTPDLIVVAALFVLRIGVPLVLVLGGGFLAARYLESRRAANQRARFEQTEEEAVGQEARKPRKVA